MKLALSLITLVFTAMIQHVAFAENLRGMTNNEQSERVLQGSPWTDPNNCGNYEFTINCTTPTQTGGTNKKVSVEIYSHCNWRRLVETREFDNGFCQNGAEFIQVNDACMVDGITLNIDGDGDPVFIDHINITRDGKDVPWGTNGYSLGWGIIGGNGWCLSKDPNDFFGENWPPVIRGMDFEAVCVDRIHFDWQRCVCTDDFSNSCMMG